MKNVRSEAATSEMWEMILKLLEKEKTHTHHDVWNYVLCGCVDVWRALVFSELYADYAIREHHVQD